MNHTGPLPVRLANPLVIIPKHLLSFVQLHTSPMSKDIFKPCADLKKSWDSQVLQLEHAKATPDSLTIDIIFQTSQKVGE